MSTGLRELLSLPESKRTELSAQAEEFGRAFRAGMTQLNRHLQVVAVQASRTEHEPLEAQRARLYDAFQKVSSQIDPADPAQGEQGIQRVMSAVALISEKASALADQAIAGRQQWLKREADFDDAMLQIGELEAARHPKAAALRKVGNAIRARAQQHQHAEAMQALDQLHPKLAAVYDQHQQQADSGDDQRSGRVDAVMGPNGKLESTSDETRAARDNSELHPASTQNDEPRNKRKQELAKMRKQLQEVMNRLGV